MCITFCMLNPNAGPDQWQLVLINNRDEHYDRPAYRAAWRDGILAGRDAKAGGTWLALNGNGRIGILTNILEPPEKAPPNALSRGSLAMNFVKNAQEDPVSYLSTLGNAESYPGFSLLLLQKAVDSWKVAFYNNRFEPRLEILPPGVYGFGNCPRNRPFQKVQRGLQMFQQTLTKYFLTTDSDKRQFVEDLIGVLSDKTPCYPDGQLQAQGTHLTPPLQEKLSARFVEYPLEYKYGTRTHTIILIDGANNVTHIERTMDESDWKAPWLESKHEFILDTK